MKKNSLILLLAVGIGSFVALTTGCSKDDTTGPVVTLTGSSSEEVSLNSAAWSDPGATASDEEDGTVTVSSDASSTNPNTNQTGTYTITYTATDKAGNVGTATRSVRVKNDAEAYAGNYNVIDTSGGITYNYTQTITIDETTNNRVHFNRFADYANNTGIYATMLPNGNLEIPSQTALNIGTANGGSCDVANHTFSSNAFAPVGTGFALTYTDLNLCNSSATDFGALFTRQ